MRHLIIRNFGPISEIDINLKRVNVIIGPQSSGVRLTSWTLQITDIKKVKVDGCAIKTGQKCDDLLISQDEHEEHFVELKGVDIMHTIDQLEQTILKIGEFDDNRPSVVCQQSCWRCVSLLNRLRNTSASWTNRTERKIWTLL